MRETFFRDIRILSATVIFQIMSASELLELHVKITKVVMYSFSGLVCFYWRSHCHAGGEEMDARTVEPRVCRKKSGDANFTPPTRLCILRTINPQTRPQCLGTRELWSEKSYQNC
jgi:hypothetical protein